MANPKIMDKIKTCEGIIDYEFNNKRHAADALYAYSAYSHELSAMMKKNDSLAILGDAVLKHSLCKKWFALGLSKKEWTDITQETSGNSNLALIGKSRGLDVCIVLNPGTPKVTDSVLATTLLAIIGAVSLDGGEEAAEQMMKKLGLSHELLDKDYMESAA